MSDQNSPSLYQPEFPSTWSEQNLIDLAEWTNGKAFASDHFSENGKPIIKISEIKDGIDNQTNYTDGSFKEKYKLSDGDLLFAWSGSPDTSIDVFYWDGPDGWLNQHIFKIESNHDCSGEFIFYLLKYIKPNLVEIARNNQTTGLGHVRKKDLEQLRVRLPTQSEQAAIVDILSPIDKKRRVNDEITTLLQKIAETIFKSWFIDFDPYENFKDTELGPIPVDFNIGMMSDIAEIEMGSSPKSEYYNEDGEGLPFFQGKKNFGEVYPSVERWCSKPKKVGESGDIIMTVRAPVGDINRLQQKSCIGRGVAAFRSNTFENNDFIYYLLRARKNRWAKFSSGTTYKSVNTTDVNEFPIIRPPDSEIKRFNETVGRFTDIIKKNFFENKNLMELRATLLPKLMSGEIRVDDIDLDELKVSNEV